MYTQPNQSTQSALLVSSVTPAGSKIVVIGETYGPWEAGHFAKGDGWK